MGWAEHQIIISTMSQNYPHSQLPHTCPQWRSKGETRGRQCISTTIGAPVYIWPRGQYPLLRHCIPAYLLIPPPILTVYHKNVTKQRLVLFLHRVLHDWCNKGRGMCYPVCGMVHIKEPLLLIDKSSLCGGSGFPFSLSEWSSTICLTPYNRR